MCTIILCVARACSWQRAPESARRKTPSSEQRRHKSILTNTHMACAGWCNEWTGNQDECAGCSAQKDGPLETAILAAEIYDNAKFINYSYSQCIGDLEMGLSRVSLVRNTGGGSSEVRICTCNKNGCLSADSFRFESR